MILDRIENAALYHSLHPRLAKAFEMLKDKDFINQKPGRYEIDGTKIFATIQEYPTKPREQGKWEAHRKYIDVQFIATGAELMGYAPLPSLKVTQAYNPEKDIMFLEGDGSFVRVDQDMFAIFYPQDAHMPMLAVATPQEARKIVVKVMVE